MATSSYTSISTSEHDEEHESLLHAQGQCFAKRQSININTAAARSSADNELSHGGQYFAERQIIQMNTAAARSTAVIIVVDNTLLKGKVFK